MKTKLDNLEIAKIGEISLTSTKHNAWELANFILELLKDENLKEYLELAKIKKQTGRFIE